MATHTGTYAGHQDTDAAFREWGSLIGAQLAAFGWVQTSDTGQIDWVTVTKPNAGQIAGYEMWRMNDALQAALPVFLKLEYAATNQTNPRLYVTVGTATDGIGNLTGTQTSARQALEGSTAHLTSGSYTCILSGDASRFTMALWLDHVSPSQTLWLSVERSKDASGNDDAVGIIVAGGSGALATTTTPAITFMQFIPASGGMPNVEGRLPAILSTAGLGSTAFGTTVGMGVPIPLAGSAQNPGKNMLVHLVSDFTRDTQHSVAMYGTNHTYYICGPNIPNLVSVGNPVASVNNGTRLALRYE